MNTPTTRTLPQVLLAALTPPDGLRLVIGTFANPPGTGAHRNVIVEGQTLSVPALSGSPASAGGVAYLLASRDFLLCIGTVA